MTETLDSWPAGSTFVSQGTVLEDATAGTHVCTLTVTPGAGNEFNLRYGKVVVGATATAQLVEVFIDDGTNVLTSFEVFNATTSSQQFSFPHSYLPTGTGNFPASMATDGFVVSGTMRLVLKVTTTAVSVTQTFAVVCRIKGAIPTATLADTVGAPTLTTNTNLVF